MKPRLNVIIASTRPDRIGPTVAKWFDAFAREHGAFDVHLVDLADFKLPVYDEPQHPRLQKYEHQHTKRWSESVAAADAFAFVTPEYNYSVPGVLKNAIDWVSRLKDQPFAGKPVALQSAAIGALGGARCQYHLRQIMVFLDALVFNKPEVFVTFARTKVDEASGKLTDEGTRKVMTAQLQGFAGFINRVGPKD